jgi:hypothetical protein
VCIPFLLPPAVLAVLCNRPAANATKVSRTADVTATFTEAVTGTRFGNRFRPVTEYRQYAFHLRPRIFFVGRSEAKNSYG